MFYSDAEEEDIYKEPPEGFEDLLKQKRDAFEREWTQLAMDLASIKNSLWDPNTQRDIYKRIKKILQNTLSDSSRVLFYYTHVMAVRQGIMSFPQLVKALKIVKPLTWWRFVDISSENAEASFQLMVNMFFVMLKDHYSPSTNITIQDDTGAFIAEPANPIEKSIGSCMRPILQFLPLRSLICFLATFPYMNVGRQMANHFSPSTDMTFLHWLLALYCGFAITTKFAQTDIPKVTRCDQHTLCYFLAILCLEIASLMMTQEGVAKNFRQFISGASNSTVVTLQALITFSTACLNVSFLKGQLDFLFTINPSWVRSQREAGSPCILFFKIFMTSSLSLPATLPFYKGGYDFMLSKMQPSQVTGNEIAYGQIPVYFHLIAAAFSILTNTGIAAFFCSTPLFSSLQFLWTLRKQHGFKKAFWYWQQNDTVKQSGCASVVVKIVSWLIGAGASMAFTEMFLEFLVEINALTAGDVTGNTYYFLMFFGMLLVGQVPFQIFSEGITSGINSFKKPAFCKKKNPAALRYSLLEEDKKNEG